MFRFVWVPGERSKVRVLRFAAKLSASQHRRLGFVLGLQQQLYNAGLESWLTAFRMWKRSPDPRRSKMRFSYMDNCKTLTELRADAADWSSLDTRVGRGTLQRLDRAIRGFYSAKRGFPRFKARSRWRSVWVPDAHMGMLRRPGEGGKWWRLGVKGLPGMRFDGARLDELGEFDLLEIRVVRAALRTEVQAVIREPVPEQIPEPQNPAGLDAGITHRFAVSDGSTVPQRLHERRQVKRRQRAVARSAKGSNSRRKKVRLLAKEHARRAEARRDEDFRVIAGLAGRFDGFAVEDLRVGNMIRNRRLSDKIAQQGWAAFADRLQHKAERAGAQFRRVDPSWTSQECSACGHRLQDKLTLRDRVFVCPQCGLVEDRDINAAANICDRAWPGAVPGGETPGVRRTTNFGIETDRPHRDAAERTEQHQHRHTAAQAA